MTTKPSTFFPTSVEAYRATLTVCNREAEAADARGSRESFDLWARLFHAVAGMCVEEHGVELREEFVR